MMRPFATSLSAWFLGLMVGLATLQRAPSVSAEDAASPSGHPQPLTPEEAVKHFKVADGLEIGLVVAEPQVAQPLSICFDDRGRMWVLQYRQYPNPNGLKPIKMDNWLRTKYDRVPEPPPLGPQGQDRISIYEDVDGDGRSDSVKNFLSDLNLASGMALGYDGVFVVQPPYLLFYADANHDDLPDGPPEVLLQGFGMEDAHAFANSLTWGPDGWLYGAQGSTATADIRGIGFQQGVWRYHPRTREFELFAEGGGNSWGVEFDQFGNLFAAGNTVEPLVHHVQGAYYVKGFGKHGPLHNPHAYGYFQPVLHHGYVGDSLTGGAIIYQGGAFPTRFHGACIAPNTRHSACRWSTLETRTSTFATRAAGDFVLSDDIWFRPVDMTVGPDGAVYIADWYDYNISHSSPLNRSEWYQPSRLDGRVWRVAPPGLPAIRGRSVDLAAQSSAELVSLLEHSNDWYARQARRLLAERRDASVTALLTRLLDHQNQRLALQGLWALYVSDCLDDDLVAKTLASPHEYIRAWTVRLLGDKRSVTPEIGQVLIRLARDDASAVVRSQLACTAKRLPAEIGLAIVEQLIRHPEDIHDVHLPLLIWWAVEDKAIANRERVLKLYESPDVWRLPLVEQVLTERLTRRLTAEGTPETLVACATLLHHAPTAEDTDRLLHGMLQALTGRKLESIPAVLQAELAKRIETSSTNAKVLELGLRTSAAGIVEETLRRVLDNSTDPADRAALIQCLGETRNVQALDGMLSLLASEQSEPLQLATLAALGYFNDDRIADQILKRLPAWGPNARIKALDLLCSRPNSARKLMEAIDDTRVAAAMVSLEQVRQMRAAHEPRLDQLINKHFGRVQAATPLQKLGRITAVQQMLLRGPGNATRGQEQFKTICAKCHKLHDQGELVGPDLTGADRKNRDLLVRNVVDPSEAIREQYLAHIATTTDGRILTGLLAESSAETVTLLDAKNTRTVINRADLEDLVESPVSLMPDGLLDPLTEQQIRDLFAFLQAEPGK